MLSQLAILRQAKYPGEARALIVQYQIARKGIAAALMSPSQEARILASTRVALEQRRDDPSSSPFVADDARRSIETVDAFERQRNLFDLGGVQFSIAPRSDPLQVNGVEVSVVPDAVCTVSSRQGGRVGELFVRCAIGGQGEAAESRRIEANVHLATIAHMHAAANLEDLGTPYASASMVIDVPRGRLVRGPASIVNRTRNIEAACTMIAAIWPTI